MNEFNMRINIVMNFSNHLSYQKPIEFTNFIIYFLMIINNSFSVHSILATDVDLTNTGQYYTLSNNSLFSSNINSQSSEQVNLKNKEGLPQCLAVHPLEKGIFAIGTSNKVQIYDGEEYRVGYRSKDTIISLVFSKSGRVLGICTSENPIIYILSINKWFKCTPAHFLKVVYMFFSSNEEYVCSIAENYTLNIYKMDIERQQIKYISTHIISREADFQVIEKYEASFNPQINLIAAPGCNCLKQISQKNNFKAVQIEQINHSKFIKGCYWFNSNILATTGSDNTLKIWNFKALENLITINDINFKKIRIVNQNLIAIDYLGNLYKFLKSSYLKMTKQQILQHQRRQTQKFELKLKKQKQNLDIKSEKKIKQISFKQNKQIAVQQSINSFEIQEKNKQFKKEIQKQQVKSLKSKQQIRLQKQSKNSQMVLKKNEKNQINLSKKNDVIGDQVYQNKSQYQPFSLPMDFSMPLSLPNQLDLSSDLSSKKQKKSQKVKNVIQIDLVDAPTFNQQFINAVEIEEESQITRIFANQIGIILKKYIISSSKTMIEIHFNDFNKNTAHKKKELFQDKQYIYFDIQQSAIVYANQHLFGYIDQMNNSWQCEMSNIIGITMGSDWIAVMNKEEVKIFDFKRNYLQSFSFKQTLLGIKGYENLLVIAYKNDNWTLMNIYMIEGDSIKTLRNEQNIPLVLGITIKKLGISYEGLIFIQDTKDQIRVYLYLKKQWEKIQCVDYKQKFQLVGMKNYQLIVFKKSHQIDINSILKLKLQGCFTLVKDLKHGGRAGSKTTTIQNVLFKRIIFYHQKLRSELWLKLKQAREQKNPYFNLSTTILNEQKINHKQLTINSHFAYLIEALLKMSKKSEAIQITKNYITLNEIATKIIALFQKNQFKQSAKTLELFFRDKKITFTNNKDTKSLSDYQPRPANQFSTQIKPESNLANKINQLKSMNPGTTDFQITKNNYLDKINNIRPDLQKKIQIINNNKDFPQPLSIKWRINNYCQKRNQNGTNLNNTNNNINNTNNINNNLNNNKFNVNSRFKPVNNINNKIPIPNLNLLAKKISSKDSDTSSINFQDKHKDAKRELENSFFSKQNLKKQMQIGARTYKQQPKQFLTRLISHYKQFCEFHRKKKLDVKKTVRHAKDKYQILQRKKQFQKQQKEAAIRLKILKQNDMDGYMKMIKETKNMKIRQVLQQTNGFLKQLGVRVLVQKGKQPNQAKDIQFQQNQGDLENQYAEANKIYYSLTQTIKQQIKTQPNLIVGGKLKSYQINGLQWLVSLYNNNLNGILADQMGLGKTIQVIALIAHLIQFKKDYGPFLIVVPLSTIANWQQQFQQWTPQIKKISVKGKIQQRKKIFYMMKTTKWNVCIATYQMVMIERQKLAAIEWSHLIVDEGHKVKNIKSKFSVVLGTQYRSNHRLLLTGTPLQNNLSQLWALLNFLLPKVFSSCQDFEKWFSIPITSKGNQKEKLQLTQQQQLLIINRLHQVLRLFLLRREKRQVEAELPQKKQQIIKVQLSPLQKIIYNNIGKRNIEADKKASMNLMMQLRKVCNHPFLLLTKYDDLLKEQMIYNTSGKMELLDRLIPKLLKFKHRILLFSQMTTTIDLIQAYFIYKNFRYLRLDGSIKPESRNERMQQFNKVNSQYDIFLLSTRAGGLGLNLQTADTVILFDSDWNPQMDIQAQDRAHRIGQRNEVLVLRFVTNTWIQEDILTKAAYKKGLDKMFIQGGLYNFHSSEAQRINILQNMLKEKFFEYEQSDEIPNDRIINKMIARNEMQYDAYNRMDEIRYHSDSSFLRKNVRNYRLIHQQDIPDWLIKRINDICQENQIDEDYIRYKKSVIKQLKEQELIVQDQPIQAEPVQQQLIQPLSQQRINQQQQIYASQQKQYQSQMDIENSNLGIKSNKSIISNKSNKLNQQDDKKPVEMNQNDKQINDQSEKIVEENPQYYISINERQNEMIDQNVEQVKQGLKIIEFKQSINLEENQNKEKLIQEESKIIQEENQKQQRRIQQNNQILDIQHQELKLNSKQIQLKQNKKKYILFTPQNSSDSQNQGQGEPFISSKQNKHDQESQDKILLQSLNQIEENQCNQNNFVEDIQIPYHIQNSQSQQQLPVIPEPIHKIVKQPSQSHSEESFQLKNSKIIKNLVKQQLDKQSNKSKGKYEPDINNYKEKFDKTNITPIETIYENTQEQVETLSKIILQIQKQQNLNIGHESKSKKLKQIQKRKKSRQIFKPIQEAEQQSQKSSENIRIKQNKNKSTKNIYQPIKQLNTKIQPKKKLIQKSVNDNKLVSKDKNEKQRQKVVVKQIIKQVAKQIIKQNKKQSDKQTQKEKHKQIQKQYQKHNIQSEQKKKFKVNKQKDKQSKHQIKVQKPIIKSVDKKSVQKRKLQSESIPNQEKEDEIILKKDYRTTKNHGILPESSYNNTQNMTQQSIYDTFQPTYEVFFQQQQNISVFEPESFSFVQNEVLLQQNQNGQIQKIRVQNIKVQQDIKVDSSNQNRDLELPGKDFQPSTLNKLQQQTKEKIEQNQSQYIEKVQQEILIQNFQQVDSSSESIIREINCENQLEKQEQQQQFSEVQKNEQNIQESKQMSQRFTIRSKQKQESNNKSLYNIQKQTQKDFKNISIETNNLVNDVVSQNQKIVQSSKIINESKDDKIKGLNKLIDRKEEIKKDKIIDESENASILDDQSSIIGSSVFNIPESYQQKSLRRSQNSSKRKKLIKQKNKLKKNINSRSNSRKNFQEYEQSSQQHKIEKKKIIIKRGKVQKVTKKLRRSKKQNSVDEESHNSFIDDQNVEQQSSFSSNIQFQTESFTIIQGQVEEDRKRRKNQKNKQNNKIIIKVNEGVKRKNQRNQKQNSKTKAQNPVKNKSEEVFNKQESDIKQQYLSSSEEVFNPLKISHKKKQQQKKFSRNIELYTKRNIFRTRKTGVKQISQESFIVHEDQNDDDEGSYVNQQEKLQKTQNQKYIKKRKRKLNNFSQQSDSQSISSSNFNSQSDEDQIRQRLHVQKRSRSRNKHRSENSQNSRRKTINQLKKKYDSHYKTMQRLNKQIQENNQNRLNYEKQIEKNNNTKVSEARGFIKNVDLKKISEAELDYQDESESESYNPNEISQIQNNRHLRTNKIKKKKSIKNLKKNQDQSFSQAVVSKNKSIYSQSNSQQKSKRNEVIQNDISKQNKNELILKEKQKISAFSKNFAKKSAKNPLQMQQIIEDSQQQNGIQRQIEQYKKKIHLLQQKLQEEKIKAQQDIQNKCIKIQQKKPNQTIGQQIQQQINISQNQQQQRSAIIQEEQEQGKYINQQLNLRTYQIKSNEPILGEKMSTTRKILREKLVSIQQYPSNIRQNQAYLEEQQLQSKHQIPQSNIRQEIINQIDPSAQIKEQLQANLFQNSKKLQIDHYEKSINQVPAINPIILEEFKNQNLQMKQSSSNQLNSQNRKLKKNQNYLHSIYQQQQNKKREMLLKQRQDRIKRYQARFNRFNRFDLPIYRMYKSSQDRKRAYNLTLRSRFMDRRNKSTTINQEKVSNQKQFQNIDNINLDKVLINIKKINIQKKDDINHLNPHENILQDSDPSNKIQIDNIINVSKNMVGISSINNNSKLNPISVQINTQKNMHENLDKPNIITANNTYENQIANQEKQVVQDFKDQIDQQVESQSKMIRRKFNRNKRNRYLKQLKKKFNFKIDSNVIDIIVINNKPLETQQKSVNTQLIQIRDEHSIISNNFKITGKLQYNDISNNLNQQEISVKDESQDNFNLKKLEDLLKNTRYLDKISKVLESISQARSILANRQNSTPQKLQNRNQSKDWLQNQISQKQIELKKLKEQISKNQQKQLPIISKKTTLQPLLQQSIQSSAPQQIIEKTQIVAPIVKIEKDPIQLAKIQTNQHKIKIQFTEQEQAHKNQPLEGNNKDITNNQNNTKNCIIVQNSLSSVIDNSKRITRNQYKNMRQTQNRIIKSQNISLIIRQPSNSLNRVQNSEQSLFKRESIYKSSFSNSVQPLQNQQMRRAVPLKKSKKRRSKYSLGKIRKTKKISKRIPRPMKLEDQIKRIKESQERLNEKVRLTRSVRTPLVTGLEVFKKN